MSRDPDRAFFGHPIGLRTLFFTEMWERFSYYGMRAILTLYIISKPEHGGLGMTIQAAGIVYALYTSTVYMLSLPGGWIADRFLGQRRAVIYGGIGIAAGNALLAIPLDQLFFPGLATIAIGTGLLKPNISTIVGQLYSREDIRRDSGFTVYYFGINLGAGVAPIACGFFAQSAMFGDFLADRGIDPALSWHFAFAAAAVGMVAGLVQYVIGFHHLGDAGMHPTIPTDPVKAARDRTILKMIVGGIGALVALAVVLVVTDTDVSRELIANIFGVGLLVAAVVLFVGMLQTARDADEKRRVIAMIPLFLGGIAFFGTFEQAGSTLNIFAERTVERIVPASYFQNINASFILILAPVFAAVWLALAKRGKEPTSVTKFAIGMVLTALAFVVVLPSLGAVTDISNVDETLGKIPYAEDALDKAMDPMRVSWLYLLALYFFQTTSELCISPVGLSSMSKLAPARMAGMVMGTWFLATAIGNYLAGRAAGLTQSNGYGFLFYTLIIVSLGVAVALAVVSPMIRRMMQGEKTPLPEARVVHEPAEDAAS
jgi:POT family proton-dependent oligopeptide transporter